MFDEIEQIILGVVFLCFVTIFLVKLSKRGLHHDLRAKNVKMGHTWCYTGMFSRPSYCNVCESLIMTSDGSFCDSCGICADSPQCISEANSQLKCKAVSNRSSVPRHYWIKGNLPLKSLCFVCDFECGNECKLSDFYCCWCLRCVHTDCLPNMAEICDFGDMKQFIVPPQCIKLKSSRIKKQMLIQCVTPPDIKNWTPLIVIGNKMSGSYEGQSILSAFRKVLNPAQVFDLADTPPEEALEWCHLVPPSVTCRLIVAGGDGTIGWVLNSVHKLRLQNPPFLSILPLGTGNDLSRVLGWGESNSNRLCPTHILKDLSLSEPGLLDCWSVEYLPARYLAGLRMPAKSLYMNNYLSIGVDALVTLNFHRTRQSPFYIFNNRLINKLIYITYGTKDVIEHECKDLEGKLTLYMDNKLVELPKMESLVVLNIPCWGAGVQPWTMGLGGPTAPKQSICDGKLEVFSLASSFHIAQLQVGLSEPHRIGQCSTLKVILYETVPMQIDGEPWEQYPGTLTLSFSHQAKVLINRS